MIVAITGATGFIGRRLMHRHLEAGDAVRILTRRDPGALGPCAAQVFSADLAVSSPSDLVPFVEGADLLYHCAGEIRDPTQMEALHVRGTSALLTAASGRAGRWIQLSSVGVYGIQRHGVVTEDSPPQPAGTYELTKAQSDRLVTEAAARGKIESTILRPSNVFGAGMPNQSLFQLVKLIDRGMFVFVGPTGASANYIHVENVIDALQLCGTSALAAGRVYNLSDWRTMEAFVSTIAHFLQRKDPHLRVPYSLMRLFAATLTLIPRSPVTPSRVYALTSRSRYSTTRIETELGYSSRVSVEAGLAELVSDWKVRD